MERTKFQVFIISLFITSCVVLSLICLFRPLSHTDDSMKYILYWNGYQGNESFYFGEGQMPFVRHNCTVKNCFATSRLDYLKSLDDYDVIIFSTEECENYTIPPVRKTYQRYVFATKESPAYYRKCKEQFYAPFYFFNWTMTYRLDSDLLWNYGYIQDIKTSEIIAPSLNPLWKNLTFIDPYYLVVAQEKLTKYPFKTIAWFVSNCETDSKRESIVQKLQKYIPVDVYGKCGNLSCSTVKRLACYNMLDTKYKFYLSFENSLSTDYVTEKLFNILKLNVVPIVYGGANYTRFAPPHSYINFQDFQSAKNLSDYLIFVMHNPYEYAKYFTWKRYYKVSNISPFCKLCENLNNPKLRYIAPVSAYSDVQQWWSN